MGKCLRLLLDELEDAASNLLFRPLTNCLFLEKKFSGKIMARSKSRFFDSEDDDSSLHDDSNDDDDDDTLSPLRRPCCGVCVNFDRSM